MRVVQNDDQNNGQNNGQNDGKLKKAKKLFSEKKQLITKKKQLIFWRTRKSSCFYNI